MSGDEKTRAFERKIFDAFLKADRRFASHIAGEWFQPEDDPPDVAFIDTAGRRVGVELKSWINREQMEAAKKREHLERRFLRALTPLPTNPSTTVSFVRLSCREPGPDVKEPAPTGDDARLFKSELLSLIQEQDRGCSARSSECVEEKRITEFGDRPTLERYLVCVTLLLVKMLGATGPRWVGFRPRSGFYDERAMLEPLKDLDASTRAKYATTKATKGLDRWEHRLIDPLSRLVAVTAALITPGRSGGRAGDRARRSAIWREPQTQRLTLDGADRQQHQPTCR